MKKLLEFGVFDILKDPKNEEFLDKVKKENRDLYPQFLNILKRKGLEVAMKEYEPHDPNYIKIMQKRDKKITGTKSGCHDHVLSDTPTIYDTCRFKSLQIKVLVEK